MPSCRDNYEFTIKLTIDYEGGPRPSENYIKGILEGMFPIKPSGHMTIIEVENITPNPKEQHYPK